MKGKSQKYYFIFLPHDDDRNNFHRSISIQYFLTVTYDRGSENVEAARNENVSSCNLI